ncbi:MAG: hypothetical protein AVDCRST_MAG70-2348 [uncultured Thermomicrobiales bacterium]|uniref:Uncharacterized protein n=1 Tax=uncultured Thermomicrobiales bacterium TaxID=1645740 RepID=A0A6J4V8A1_9BACT|nr:MAG: hypothetical protein AVDCRST_MAG70-2348 [uncultured Thermomicrobiales bacterium]
MVATANLNNDEASDYAYDVDTEKSDSKVKLYAIGGGLGALVLLALLIFGLYQLGDDGQSALERFRDIAVIFVVLLFLLTVVLLAAIAAALGYLVLQIKDRVIPLLEEVTGTARRIRGTTAFMTEEAIKPIMTVASTYARMRAMTKTVTGKSKKPPKVKF